MNIYLRAYADCNLGDDLMIQELLNQNKSHNFFLFSNYDISDELLETPNLFVKKRKKEIPDCDVLISIGGSIYQYHSYKDLLRRIRLISQLVVYKIQNKKTAVIGCNLGPFNKIFSKKLTHIDLKLRDLVTVRDKYSYDVVKSMSINNAYLLPDIVYQIDFDDKFNLKSCSQNKTLGVSTFTPTENESYNSLYFDEVASACDDLYKVGYKKINLYCFQTGRKKDDYAAQEIAKRIKYSDVETIKYTGNSKEFLNEFSKADTMIATRFHSAILSHKLGIDFYPVIYSNKLRNLLTDYNYEGGFTFSNEFQEGTHHAIVADITARNIFNSEKNDVLEYSTTHFELFKMYITED